MTPKRNSILFELYVSGKYCKAAIAINNVKSIYIHKKILIEKNNEVRPGTICKLLNSIPKYFSNNTLINKISFIYRINLSVVT